MYTSHTDNNIVFILFISPKHIPEDCAGGRQHHPVSQNPFIILADKGHITKLFYLVPSSQDIIWIAQKLFNFDELLHCTQLKFFQIGTLKTLYLILIANWCCQFLYNHCSPCYYNYLIVTFRYHSMVTHIVQSNSEK